MKLRLPRVIGDERADMRLEPTSILPIRIDDRYASRREGLYEVRQIENVER